MPIRAGDPFWPTGPEFHPSAPFTIPRVNGARHQDPPGLVWGEQPAHSSVGLAPYCSPTPIQCSDTFQLPLRQFLSVTNVAEAVGQEPPGLLPAKPIFLNMHFPGVTHVYIWKWESRSVEREQDVFKREGRQCGYHLAGGEEGLR